MKVISFSQQGPRAICILSANGVISSVTLRQPDSSGGTLTYEVLSYSCCLMSYSKCSRLLIIASVCYILLSSFDHIHITFLENILMAQICIFVAWRIDVWHSCVCISC